MAEIKNGLIVPLLETGKFDIAKNLDKREENPNEPVSLADTEENA